MATTNHWGIQVDSETPITGVLNVGDVAWEWVDDEICLTCDEIEAEAIAEDGEDADLDFIECDPSHTRIFGDWLLNEDGKYEPDKNGEFAAISNEATVQVVWSKTTARAALCSPCYPGQADMDTPGDFLAYTLPDYLLSK